MRAPTNPSDPRTRVAYHRVPALDATVRDVQEVTGIAVADADIVELYSCFPAMPKLTRRAMGRAADAPISLIGGLSFFGGPGSNYLTHSVATMVERIRADGGTGSCTASACSTPSTTRWCWPTTRVDDGAIRRRVHDIGARRPPVEAPVPVVEDYAGPGTVLTCTVMFDRDGTTRNAAR